MCSLVKKHMKSTHELLGLSLALLAHVLALHCSRAPPRSFVLSLAPDLMGKRLESNVGIQCVDFTPFEPHNAIHHHAMLRSTYFYEFPFELVVYENEDLHSTPRKHTLPHAMHSAMIS